MWLQNVKFDTTSKSEDEATMLETVHVYLLQIVTSGTTCHFINAT